MDLVIIGIVMVKEEYVDLLLMDVGLLDIDGCEVVKFLRKNGFKVLIIMLIGYDGDSDIILGLEVGVNDYVIKLFKFVVFLVWICVYLC